MSDSFHFNGKYLSQIPALKLLINLGYTYYTPEQISATRGGEVGQVLLEEVLREWLKKNNRIQREGRNDPLSEEDIQTAIQRLKDVGQGGLPESNEAVHRLLTLGLPLEQSIEGENKRVTLDYIDWKNPANNDYHVTAGFSVACTRSSDICRPDIVLFVNGIPFAVIECKSPEIEVDQAVLQMVRNQSEECIPELFAYTQLLLAANGDEVKYAVTGTPSPYWSVWKEEVPLDELRPVWAKPLPMEAKAGLFDLVWDNIFVHESMPKAAWVLTEQDRVLYALCRPERLLDLVLRFTVFDDGIRRVARYQQFFAVQRALEQVKRRDIVGRRQGGIVWHTQGSGKFLTMMMLARALALDPGIRNPRIVLATDRVDLDKRFADTFALCALTIDSTDSERRLLELICEDEARIIATCIHNYEFDETPPVEKRAEEAADIFILADESRRIHFGGFAARIRQTFPMACYLGFTGTPPLKKEKDGFAMLGGLIDVYTISQAIKDGVLLPLFYEARRMDVDLDEKAIDAWFERHVQEGIEAGKTRRHAKTLTRADQLIYMNAFDIREHFRRNWKSTGFKAQLIAPNKAVALAYKEFLDEIGQMSNALLIYPPDTCEGDEEAGSQPSDEVVAFWKQMMRRYGSEEEYNKRIIDLFKHSDAPEILIVVDKYLTDFDAPRNTVLYLVRKLHEHALLQSIARVNRVYGDDNGARFKEAGYVVDYAGTLGKFDQPLTTYSVLDAFDEADLAGALVNINEEVAKLPQRHADLWDLFKEVKSRRDKEAYEQLLIDEERRKLFYERLLSYGRTLSVAMSSEQFIASIPEKKLKKYKNDLKRFMKLKVSVKLRYVEPVDYRDIDPVIKHLMEAHIPANRTARLDEPVNIFDDQACKKVFEERGKTVITAAKVDMIAHATKKVISERLERTLAFYEKFSKLIEQVIDDFSAKRLSEQEYLTKVHQIKDAVVHRRSDDAPMWLAGNSNALILYDILRPYVLGSVKVEEKAAVLAADFAIDMWSIIQRNQKLGFNKGDLYHFIMNDIDDYMIDEMDRKKGVQLVSTDMDDILDWIVQLTKAATPRKSR